jgi:putative effector of murein hydrolase LrgA (UPF0299 family)
MNVWGYLTIAGALFVPAAIAFSTVWFLKGRLRRWLAVSELIMPILAILFCLSPLPLTLGLTRDPGYDSDAIWVIYTLIVAYVFLVMSSVGIASAALIQYMQRRKGKTQ